MGINHALVAELKHESANTRKIIERVPSDKLTWKPHEKSMTLGRLAAHVATITGWIGRVIHNAEFDMAANALQIPNAVNTEQLIKMFDDTFSINLKALETAADELLNSDWTFRNGKQVFFTLPRKVVLRNMAFNHLIHHRGQLSVYLRLLDVPVPGMYGPSADER